LLRQLQPILLQLRGSQVHWLLWQAPILQTHQRPDFMCSLCAVCVLLVQGQPAAVQPSAR
jgi:hypothetical protein